MSAPAWAWAFVGAEDQRLDRPISPVFTTRFDAEAWLGEQWRRLAAEGAHATQLLHHGSPVAPLLPLRAG